MVFGVNPVKMALDEVEKKVNSIDLNHDGHPDVQEIKAEFAVIKQKVDKATAVIGPIAAKIDETKIKATLALPVVQAVLHELGITDAEVNLVFAEVKEAASVAPRLLAVGARAEAFVKALA